MKKFMKDAWHYTVETSKAGWKFVIKEGPKYAIGLQVTYIVFGIIAATIVKINENAVHKKEVE